MKPSGRHALVVGLGKSGDAAVRLLRSRGAQVAAADDKDLPFEGELRRVVPESLRGMDLVVVSPGVPLSLPIFAEARSLFAEMANRVVQKWWLMPVAPLTDHLASYQGLARVVAQVS